MAKTEFTREEINKKYNRLSLKQKNEVLFEAIDFMSQYNGRTRFCCIALAMGYSTDDEKTYSKN